MILGAGGFIGAALVAWLESRDHLVHAVTRGALPALLAGRRHCGHVIVCIGDEVVATLQLTLLHHLSHRGAIRAQIESVRVARAFRGRGIGHQLMEWALARARDRGARVAQLSTDKSRVDAHRFYEALGFRATHEGYKLAL